MTRQFKIDAPEEHDALDRMAQGLLGTATDRPEGVLKVTGAATYAAEVQVENMAHGFLVRAPKVGEVGGSNADEIRAMPGVLDVITDERLIRNSAQGTANEAPVQGTSRAAYVGQAIAVVVAETFEQARHAAQAMTFEIAGETVAVDPEAPETKVETPEKQQTNIGDLDGAMSSAAHAIDETYRTGGHTSAPMEPHAAIADWKDGNVLLRGSLQMLKYNRNELADSLGIDPEHVRILAPYVGGGFGSKLGISAECVAAAIAAEKLGRPVSVVQHRRQVFETTVHRSSTRQRIRLAADGEGRLSGLGHDSLVYNLPDESFSEPVAQATHFSYAGEHRHIGHHIARVHRPATGSVRAPGEAVGVTAFEIAMDELAYSAGIDPVELRKRNIPERDPEGDKPFSTHLLAETLDEGARRFGWEGRDPTPKARKEGEWWLGTGMSAAFRVNMQMPAEVRVILTAEGARVETDMTDIGTGTYAILGQIAGEMLGLPMERVDVRLGDTDFPPGSGSGGSFGAASNGNATTVACTAIREQLAERMGCDESELTLKDGQAVAGNVRKSIEELLAGETVTETGSLQPGEAFKKVRQSTFGAHFAEVAVNGVTGETRVRRLEGTYAAGRILNPRTAASQCHGGMTWGIGMALTEELIHDPRSGAMMNRDFAEYHLAVNADVPDLKVHFVEERDPWTGPLQAKGIGELSICGAGSAVINAIYHATGVRVRGLPATPDKVMAGL